MVESSRAGLAFNINLEINTVSLFVWFNCGLGGSVQTGKSHSDFSGFSVYSGFPAGASSLRESDIVRLCRNSLAISTGLGLQSLMEDLPLS